MLRVESMVPGQGVKELVFSLPVQAAPDEFLPRVFFRERLEPGPDHSAHAELFCSENGQRLTEIRAVLKNDKICRSVEKRVVNGLLTAGGTAKCRGDKGRLETKGPETLLLRRAAGEVQVGRPRAETVREDLFLDTVRVCPR